MARRIKEGNENERDNPASNQFPKCSPSSGIHRDSQSWVEKRRGREESETTWWRKMRVKRGESNKMGPEDWIPKSTKLITNTKKQIFKI